MAQLSRPEIDAILDQHGLPAKTQSTITDRDDLLISAADLDTENADALVLSSCVQMPSLASIQAAEDRLNLPVFSAATATTYAS